MKNMNVRVTWNYRSMSTKIINMIMTRGLRPMMFWNRNKKEKAAAGNEKNRFDHLLSVAENYR